MSRTLARCLLALVALALSTAHAADDGAAPSSWLGQTESELVERLGPPAQVKTGSDGGKVLVYDGAVRWLVAPGETDVTGDGERTEEKKRGGKVTTTWTREDTDPYDPTDAPPLWIDRDPAAVTDKLRVFVDPAGRVWKVKLGRRTLEQRAPAR